MDMLKEYKNIFLAGFAVVLFFAAAYFVVGNSEQKDGRYTYAEHIFREGVVNEINIEIDEADWQEMLENPLEEEYHRANVTINGETIGNVAIRTKGNNTLTSVASSDSDRYSLKIDFDYYDDNGNYYGLRKLCLNNNYGDNSYMREYISYQIMEDMGIPVPGCGYSHITINGEEWGLYLAVEPIDEVFLSTHFEDGTGDLYKPDGTGADLVYRSDDISAYSGLELKTNEGTSDGSKIIALMKALESGENLTDVLDIESALKYIAANVALGNYDSYLGGTTHNYYLYEQDGVFSVLPWDFNYSFGAFGGGEVDIYEPANNTMARGGNREEKQTREENMTPPENVGEIPKAQNVPANKNIGERPVRGQNGGTKPENRDMPMGENNVENEAEQPVEAEGKGFGGMGGSLEKPLVTTLLENETFLARYEEYLNEFVNTYFTEGYIAVLVTEIHTLIAPYVEQDATAFYTYEEFEQACSIDPADEYSLVYYAVNMADSIRTQLAGGEPTFNTSSLKGGGMGMGGKGGLPNFGGEMPDIDNFPDFGGEMPDMENISNSVGEKTVKKESSEMEESLDDSAFENNKDTKQGGGRPENMGIPGNMGSEKGRQQVDIKEVLSVVAVASGTFITGSIILVLFKRKKRLK